MTKITSDGTTASYYQLPEGATELQHLISHRNLNAQDGEIFRAIYRKGRASHSDELRDAKKVLFYAQAEVERLEKLHKPIIHELYPGGWTPEAIKQAAFPSELYTEDTEARMDVVGQNGNTAEHYDQAPDWSKAPYEATHWGPAVGGYCEAWVKSDMVGWLCLPASGGAGWIRERRLISDLVERPISEYQRLWTSEGLPPVGESCEVKVYDQEWFKCTAVAHYEGRAVIVLADKETAHIVNPDQLRPADRSRKVRAGNC